MPLVRGKFHVTKQTHHTPGKTHVEIELQARYSQNAEDNTFATATPSGTITMTVTNPDVVDVFPVGRDFFVDFTPVD